MKKLPKFAKIKCLLNYQLYSRFYFTHSFTHSLTHSFTQYRYYKIVVVTSLSVNTNSIPDSTLLPHDNPSWENYRYYVAALYYYYNQSTTVTIGSGIRFTFDGVSYTDVALESGKAYRVFIRLYSGADKPVRKREGGREGEREGEREEGMGEGES